VARYDKRLRLHYIIAIYAISQHSFLGSKETLNTNLKSNEMKQAEILVQEHVAAQERVTGAQHFHDMKTQNKRSNSNAR
jgi:hypothetical protein